MLKNFLLVLVVLLGGGLVAAVSPSEPKQYEYVTLHSVFGNELIAVSSGQDSYEVVKTKKITTMKNNYDYTGLHRLINELEAQGYEVLSANGYLANANGPGMAVMLRRAK